MTREKEKMLTRDEILNADDIKTEKISVPEWGGFVLIRSLTAKQKDAWENSLYETKRSGRDVKVELKKENIRARFVAISIVDESGTLMFTAGDLTALSQKSAAAMDRVFSRAQKLSSVTDEDLDVLEKNLSTTQTDSSNTN